MDEGFGGDLVGICHDRPSEAHGSRFRYLQASPRLHGVVHDMPSPMAGLPPRLRGGWQRGGGGSEGGVGVGLFGEEVVGEGGDVGYIDGAVGVDVGDCFAVGF